MNKTICDVCGTVIPETAEQCPICGCAKPEEAGAVKTYTHVKGGRFSTKNVKKRNKEKMAGRVNEHNVQAEDDAEETAGSNRGLVITVIILLLAIFAVLAYLYINYWMPNTKKPDSTGSSASTTASTQASTNPGETTTPDETAETTQPVETTVETVSGECTDIVLSETEITLSNIGDGYLLSYAVEPVDTTDTVSYASSDPSVATVDANGKITAVGPGSATVTITCGSVQASCTVTCDIATEPSTEPTTAPTVTDTDFELNREDITMLVGESWPLYRGEIGYTEITWWSDDDSVAKFSNGTVTAVGEGLTTVYAQYQGTVYQCIIRVKES